MAQKPQGYAILVRETGAELEVEWGRVQTNPAPIVEGLKAKKIDGYNPKGRRSNLLRYSSVRYIAVSIAIAIIQLSAPGHSSASPRTAHVEQCRTLSQARASFPHSHLVYRIAAGQRCWSPADRPIRHGRQSKGGRVAERPANVSERRDLPVESNRSPPTSFSDRWNLR